ncbi:TonB-dependent receptor YncD [Salmonella enterica subsp. enterica]|uniref:TonB-dependent receptor YncD n=1 Tax=Salmonella enterica I TaxID=59201 RepID=A0A3S4I063_SALET|nr:TonB-dependent receptor YncD [Salmonella enterica subsp. enterica]
MPNWACALTIVSKLSLIFNSVDIKADDPGGLTESEWKADPQQAPRAEQYNTRKTIKQTQAGLRYERQLSAQDDIQRGWPTPESGKPRNTRSIPLVAQLKPAQAGGRNYHCNATIRALIPAGLTGEN